MDINDCKLIKRRAHVVPVRPILSALTMLVTYGFFFPVYSSNGAFGFGLAVDCEVVDYFSLSKLFRSSTTGNPKRIFAPAVGSLGHQVNSQ